MKALITILILALVGWGIYVLMGDNNDAVVPGTSQEENNGTSTTTPNPAGGIELATREFTVSAQSFSFTPSTIEVNRGERVRITLNNTGGMHDLVVEGYNVRTKVLQAGQSETIEFMADEAGSFEFYCSVGNHRAMGMRGTITVNE